MYRNKVYNVYHNQVFTLKDQSLRLYARGLRTSIEMKYIMSITIKYLYMKIKFKDHMQRTSIDIKYSKLQIRL